jgi:N-acylneuraminate cytidylyltransferase
MLLESFSVMKKNDADVVIPVYEVNENPLRSMIIKNNNLKLIMPEMETVRSQDLPAVYADSGQFYWIKCSSFMENKNFMSGKVLPYTVEEKYVHDINTEEDWLTSERKYNLLKKII